MATQAKRKISKFNFKTDNSAVALVSESQGGGANGFTTLLMKAAGSKEKYSQDFLQKAAQVQVTLSFEEFLRKFFGLWYEDAKILATMLGMQEEETQTWEDNYYRDYVSEQVEKFEILKAAHEAENKFEYLTTLSEEQYLTVLKQQQIIEKAMNLTVTNDDNGGEAETATKPKRVTTRKAKTAVNKEDKSMTTLTAEEVAALQQEVALQKSAQQEKELQLQKALEALELFKAKEMEMIKKSRLADLTAVIGEEQATELYKAVGEHLDDEKFAKLLDVQKAVAANVEKSALFTEQGSKESGVDVAKSAAQATPVANALSALIAKQKQQ